MTDPQRVFVSHNSKDKPWARALAEALAIELDADSFLDENSIQVGERWDRQIQEAIERCPVALVLLGSNGWGPVHRVEAMMALERARRDATFRFVPVLLPGVDVEAQKSFADGNVFDEIHRMDLSGLQSPSQLADPDSESLIAGLRLILTGKAKVESRELTPFLLRRDAMRWDSAQRSAKLLYSDTRLEEALQLLARMGELGIPVMREYVEAGRQAKERRQRLMLGASLLLAGALIVLTLIAYQQTVNARARARAAEALTAPYRYLGLKAAIELSRDSKTSEALGAPFTLLANSGAAARIFHGSTHPITSLAVGADTVFAGNSGGDVWAWQGSSARRMATLGAPVATLQPCRDAVLAAGANGDLFLLKRGAVIRIWTGSATPSADGYGEVSKETSKPGANQITAALQLEQGRALVFDLSGAAWWIDCGSGTFGSAGSVPFKEVRHVLLAGDRVLGATENGDLFLWRPGSAQLDSRAELRVRAAGIEWTRGNMVYALDGLGTLYRWNPATSAAVAIAAISSTPLRAVIDADSSALWMSGLNGAVMRCVWDEPMSGKPSRPNAPRCKPLSAEPVHHRVVSAMVRDRTGILVSASADGSLVAWNSGQVNRLISVAPPAPADTETLALASIDPLSIFYRTDRALVRFESGQERWRTALVPASGYSACVSRDRSVVLVISSNEMLQLFDAVTGTERGRWPIRTPLLVAAAIDDGFVFVPAAGGAVTHVSSTGVRSEWIDVLPGRMVSALAGRARGKLAAVGRLDGTLQVSAGTAWQTASNAHAGPVFALDIARDGRRLISGGGAGDPSVKVWSMPQLRLASELPAEHEHTLASARFDPQQNDVAASADDAGLVVLWDLAAGRARGRVRLADDELINEIEFAGASDLLAFRGISSVGAISVGADRVRQVMQQMLVTAD